MRALSSFNIAIACGITDVEVGEIESRELFGISGVSRLVIWNYGRHATNFITGYL